MRRRGEVAVPLLGETLWLLPERALFWEERRLLLLADPHWGKAASFRAGGIPVPGGTTRQGLTRLTRAVGLTRPDGVVILGDFLHARSGRAAETLRALMEWRAEHRRLDLLLVRGNHDRHAGDPPEALEIGCVNGPLAMGPFLLAHHPMGGAEGYGIAGHLHPTVRLTGPARERHRLPCFWFGRQGMVLPAFGEFTGGADVAPLPGDRVFVVADEEIVEISR
jgi:uncharacterized protein